MTEALRDGPPGAEAHARFGTEAKAKKKTARGRSGGPERRGLAKGPGRAGGPSRRKWHTDASTQAPRPDFAGGDPPRRRPAAHPH